VDIAGAQTILDLGCGYGVIGIVTATSHPSSKVFLVDVDAQAVRAARLNAQLNGCERNTQILVSDGLRAVATVTFDLILSHFPLHIPKEDQVRLLSEARDALRPGGRLCLVALVAYDLRFLMKSVFGNVTVIADTSYKEDNSERYRVLCSAK
jgi:16S rRNA (guanine1207-N2)-methyltransferase